MVLLSFFSSIEFYVIMAVVAAAIVAVACRPQVRGEMLECLLAGRTSRNDESKSPSVEFKCLDSGIVVLTRYGIEGVSQSGAVSIAAKCDGVNLIIEERLTPGNQYDLPVDEARFDMDFLRPGRYHVRYNSDATGLFVAFQLHVRPGIVASRELTR